MKDTAAKPTTATRASRNLQTALLQFCGSIRNLAGPAVVVLLPLWFNPYAETPFEPAKVVFFRWAVGLMVLAYASEWLLARRSSLRLASSAGASREAALRRHPLVLAVTGYGVIYVLATAFSLDLHRSLWGAADKHGTVTVLCTLAFFLLLSVTLQSRNQIRRLITAMLLGSVPVVVYALAQILGADPLNWVTDSVSPVLSTMGRSNFLGAYLAMVVPFTLLRGASASSPSPSKSWRVAVLALLQVSCVLLTQARAAWLGLVAGVAVFAALLAYQRRSLNGLVICIIVLFLGGLVFLLLNFVNLPSLMGLPASSQPPDMPFHQLRTAPVLSRLVIWQATLELIRQRWPIGYGPENFAVVFNSTYPPEILWGTPGIQVDDPHNLILGQLVDLGVLGLVAFSIVVISFYSVASRELRKARSGHQEGVLAAAMGSAAAFLVQAQFNPDIIVTWVLFWVVLALAVAAPKAILRDPA